MKNSLSHRHTQLARDHAELKQRVAEYTKRRFLSPGEQMELKTLQVMKLRAKDRMVEVQRQLERAAV